jgi:hypothetical protein
MNFLELVLNSKRRRLEPPQQMYTDIPLGLRAYLLNDLTLRMQRQEQGDPTAYGREADRIFKELFDRNARAKALEKSGETDHAINLYEQNVTDCFDGTYPYERLRVIYTEREQYGAAIRVCQAFVDTADILIKLGAPRTALQPKRKEFKEWIAELERQKNG